MCSKEEKKLEGIHQFACFFPENAPTSYMTIPVFAPPNHLTPRPSFAS